MIHHVHTRGPTSQLSPQHSITGQLCTAGLLHCIGLLASQLRTNAGQAGSPNGAPSSANAASGRRLQSTAADLFPHSTFQTLKAKAHTALTPPQDPRRMLAGNDTASGPQCSMQPPINVKSMAWLSVCKLKLPDFGTCSAEKGADSDAAVKAGLGQINASSICFGISCDIPIPALADLVSVNIGANLCGPNMLAGSISGNPSVCIPSQKLSGSDLQTSLDSSTCGSKGILGNKSLEVDAIMTNTYLDAALKICVAEVSFIYQAMAA